jgi:hypothetical protein
MITLGETIPLKPGTMTMLPEDGLPNDNGGTTMMQRLGSGSAKANVVPKSKVIARNRHSLMAGHRLFSAISALPPLAPPSSLTQKFGLVSLN